MPAVTKTIPNRNWLNLGNRIMWLPQAGQDAFIDLGTLLSQGGETRLYLSHILLPAAGGGNFIRLQLAPDQSTFSSNAGPDFSDAFETGGTITLTASDGSSVTIAGGTGSDSSEPYEWDPSNAADVRTFAAALQDLTNRAVTITFDDNSGVALPAVGAQTGTRSHPVNIQLPEAEGGTGPYTYGVTGLPAGLTFSTSTRRISGTPTTAEATTVTYTVTDSSTPAGTDSKMFTFTVSAPPALGLPVVAAQDGKQDVAVNIQLPEATGGIPDYAYTATPLPAGLTFSTTTRRITGTPTTADATEVTYTVTDGESNTASRTFTFTIAPPPPPLTLAAVSTKSGRVGDAFVEQLGAAGGGTEPYNYAVTGLPAGLSFNGETRTIFGTPTTAQTVTATYQVTDDDGTVVSRTFSFQIARSLEVPYRLEVDWNGDGNFAHPLSNVYQDVLTLTAKRGRSYADQVYGRSLAGVLRASLRNDTDRYNRFNQASPLFNLAVPGRRVRLMVRPPGQATYSAIWGGRVDKIERPARRSGNNEARLIAYGPLADLTQRVISVAMQSGDPGISTADAAGLVLDAAGVPATERGPIRGTRRMTRWWVQRQRAMESLRDVEETESGFVKETQDGLIAMEAEGFRFTSAGRTTVAELSDSNDSDIPVIESEPEDPLKDIANVINVPVRAYDVGNLEVLWQLRHTVELEAGESLTLNAEYPPPSNPSAAVGVDEWATMAPTIDYTANAQPNGEGTDMTSNLSVTAEDASGVRRLTVRNTHGSNSLVITKLQARGRVVTETEPTIMQARDQDSIDTYGGERTYLVPAQFIPSVRQGQSYADFLVSFLKAPQTRASIVLDVSDHLSKAVEIDLSSRVKLTTSNNVEEMTVEAIEHTLGRGQQHRMGLLLSPADSFDDVIVLDIGPALGEGVLGR